MCFKLVAHFLDLRCLCLESSGEVSNFLLLLRDGRFLFLIDASLLLDPAMLFEKLVEQHGVHGFVTHGVRLPSFIAGHQVRIHLFHLFGHETELRDAGRVKLVLIAEGDRLE